MSFGGQEDRRGAQSSQVSAVGCAGRREPRRQEDRQGRRVNAQPAVSDPVDVGLPRLPEGRAIRGRPPRDGNGLVQPFEATALIVEHELGPGANAAARALGVASFPAIAECGDRQLAVPDAPDDFGHRGSFAPQAIQEKRLVQLVEQEGLDPGECRLGRLPLTQHAASGLHRDFSDRDTDEL